MSQSSAQRILAMYMQDNQTRLNQALELALKEAQTLQMNEQATRKLLLETLNAEQKALNGYISTLQKARTAQRRGQFDLAKANINNYQRALAQYNSDNDRYQAERARLADKNQSVRATGNRESFGIVEAEAGDVDDFATIIDKVGRAISQNATDAQILSTLQSEDFDQKLRNSDVKFSNKKFQTFGGNSTKDYKMSDLVDQLLSQMAQRGGVSVNDTKLNVIRDFMFDPNQVGGRGGTLRNLDYKSPQDREDIRLAYVDDYVDANGARPKMRKPVPPTEQVIATQSAQEKQMIADAQPVLDALGAGDDTPFQITESEREQLSQRSLQAYGELKDAYRKNPNVVNVDQAVLLDDLALQRALRVEQLKKQAATPMRKPQSPEMTMRRAAEIAEPERFAKAQAAELPASAQKYYATERKALELSEQDDDYVRAQGTPETFGITKWKELYDGTTLSQDYGTIVGEIETQFQDPAEQLRALAAFNSRAMASQRAKQPVLLPDGDLSEDYKAALEAMTPKEK